MDFLSLINFSQPLNYRRTVKKGDIAIPKARINTAIEPILLLPFQSVIEKPIVYKNMIIMNPHVNNINLLPPLNLVDYSVFQISQV